MGLLHKWFIEPTDSTVVQLFRSLFVGTSATVVDMALLFVLRDVAHLNLYLATALAFCAGVTTNYIMSVLWVFHRRQVKSRVVEIVVFVVLGVVGLGMNELLMWLLSDRLGLHYLLTKLIATMIVYFWNFFARKLILYR